MDNVNSFDREGEFRGEILEYGLQKARDSQSVAVVIRARIHDQYNFDAEAWESWREYVPYEGYGNIWIIKKDGTPNEGAIQSLVKFAGFSGELSDIVHKLWQPTPVRFSIAADTYKGETRYKIGFLGDYNTAPSAGIKSIDEAEAKALSARFGSQLRAIAGTAKRAAAPSGDKPASPPPRSAPPSAPNNQRVSNADGTVNKDDIPF